jgi:hypothetical protein
VPIVRDFPFTAFDDFSPQKKRVETKNGNWGVVTISSTEVQQRLFFFFCKCSVHSSSNRSSFSECLCSCSCFVTCKSDADLDDCVIVA